MLPKAMKIESWVPQTMDNPMQPTFGRVDPLPGSSVEITKITDSTKRHENRCVVPPGHARTEYTHVWSLRRTDIDFGIIFMCFSGVRVCLELYLLPIYSCPRLKNPDKSAHCKEPADAAHF